ncbi:3'-5' exoribonuclease YhaM [Gottschalkia acidurici 9a]|uniref:3'-5' exoribonuclease YhaM n=1 Tax=Gottschalkia acidurici (strain ATCC 7906 / DSM 604 / BCRC 14475 / CIP 104303 / KCTC 5404 / NCIMB 10678 / 9a) TaxID=1128398 RepID=K0AW59_GOTA9|nr:HD domain-containing protein [Gottschalkia acidurici]AFS77464.1 3'-5' exoribonuclease YhaM [Gottschalkia acidurici 9a]
MQYKKIKDFTVNERIDGFFMLKSVEKKVASNGNCFLDITLSDDTGEMNGKLWDYKGDDNAYIQNSIIKIRGDILEWQGKKQLKIMKLRNINDEDDLNIEDFVQSAPLSSKEMYNCILIYIDQMENEDIKRLVHRIVTENKEKLLYYPAAKKNHHAIRSGLMYHILRMINSGEKLSEIYTFINRDLLYAGIILHDMAKLEEMNSSNLGIVSEYTIEGQLLGHIIQGIENIDRVCRELNIDPEINLLIKHMILTHHYHPEYGSPKKPMIPEAELLHYLDTIDASMYDMEKALKDTNQSEFTERIWSLDNRQLYKSGINKEDTDEL